MRCIMCSGHAVFDRTVFQGTKATAVRLCSDCAAKVRAEEHMSAIKLAPDRDTKSAAVADFLKELGQ
ncbi:MAG: hypothetical protein ACYS0K_18325 [Planctomycetota bacterium]